MLGFVREEIEALSYRTPELNISIKEYSRRLGVICHYIADFFCYPHSVNFDQGSLSHIYYEYMLHRYLISKLDELKYRQLVCSQGLANCPQAVNESIDELQIEYLGAEPAFSNDIMYTLRMCSEALISIFNCSRSLSYYEKPSFISASIRLDKIKN